MRRTRPEVYTCMRCGAKKEFYYKTAGRLWRTGGCEDREACRTRVALQALAGPGRVLGTWREVL